MEKEIYLVLTQTSSSLSRAIKVVTGQQFNHISISLSPALDPMFSFGRRHPYNPFWGGFVKEYIWKGTFYRFPETKCQVLKLPVTAEQYEKIQTFLEEMYANKDNYGYNFVGLCLAAFQHNRASDNKFYCSEFIKALFLEFQIEGAESLPDITHPCDFLNFPGVESVYVGRLQDYPAGQRVASGVK
ncbi:MAG: hypothetical protein IKD18_05720 [Clostridia bacterium]|nr:hypothetical protein [Clostridia bacterium]